MRGAREAITAGRFDDYRRGTLGGEAPWELAKRTPPLAASAGFTACGR